MKYKNKIGFKYKFIIALILISVMSLLVVGCGEKTFVVKSETVLKTESGEEVGKISIESETETDCGDLDCFQKKFQKCEPATMTSTAMENLIHKYEIIGPVGNKCQVKSIFLRNPNPDWENKDMICLYESNLAFETSVQDPSDCEGELAEMLGKKGLMPAGTVSDVTVPGQVAEGGCTDNSECELSQKCIEKECKKIAELYETEGCEANCKLNAVTLITSDDETVVLKKGNSDYAYAGAITYKFLSVPNFCESADVVVPIEIEKITTGKVLNKQVITLKRGETSSKITHPLIKRINFNLKIVDIDKECS